MSRSKLVAALGLAAVMMVGLLAVDVQAGGWHRGYRGFYGNYGNYGLYPSYGFYRGYTTGYRGVGFGNPYYYGGSLYSPYGGYGYGYGYGAGYGWGYGASYGYGYTPLTTPYASGFASYGYPGASLYTVSSAPTPYVRYTPMSYTTDYAPHVYGAAYSTGSVVSPGAVYGTSYGYSPMCGCGQ